MEFKKVALRCDDGAEAVVLTKYIHSPILPNGVKFGNEIDYEICVEDDYIGGDYRGIFGRIKRAWRAFADKPVVYTGIYCEDKEKMKKFLTDCLALIDEENEVDI